MEGSTGARVSEPARAPGRIGWIAAGATIAMALPFALAAPGGGDLRPPEEVPRALVLPVLLAAPGVIGAIGMARRSVAVVGAAGVLCVLQSLVSFGGTLPFLVPAVLFLRAAGTPSEESVRWHPPRVLLAIAVLAPVAVIVTLNVGVVGVVLLVLASGLAAASRPVPRVVALRPSAGVLSAVLVCLLVAAWAALLGTAEERCWVARSTPDGLEYARSPINANPVLGGPDGLVAAGCDGGTLTLAGAALAAVLVGGAIAIAVGLPPRRREPT